MGNHDGGGAGFALSELNDVQNLRLNGYIQCGRGLIGDEHARIIGNCDGNDHALAHAARELVREGLQPQVRVGDAHEVEQLRGLFEGLLLADVPMSLNCLHQLRPNIEDRGERGERILEDHANTVATDLGHLLVAEAE